MGAEGDDNKPKPPEWLSKPDDIWNKFLAKPDESSPLAKLPNLFNWKSWKGIPDDWTCVERERTPRGEGAGAFYGDQGHHQKGGIGPKAMTPQDDISLIEMANNRLYNPVRYPHPDATIAQKISKQYHSPHYRNFLTDLGANVTNIQGGKCQDFELNAMECIEYYGAKQGLTACKDWYDDYIECVHECKQKLRVIAMFKKRHIDNHIEYVQGKRTWADTYEPPPKSHAFVEPWFNEKYQSGQGREV